MCVAATLLPQAQEGHTWASACGCDMAQTSSHGSGHAQVKVSSGACLQSREGVGHVLLGMVCQVLCALHLLQPRLRARVGEGQLIVHDGRVRRILHRSPGVRGCCAWPVMQQHMDGQCGPLRVGEQLTAQPHADWALQGMACSCFSALSNPPTACCTRQPPTSRCAGILCPAGAMCAHKGTHLLLGSLSRVHVGEELPRRGICRGEQAHVVVVQHVYQGHKPVGLRAQRACTGGRSGEPVAPPRSQAARDQDVRPMARGSQCVGP